LRGDAARHVLCFSQYTQKHSTSNTFAQVIEYSLVFNALYRA